MTNQTTNQTVEQETLVTHDVLNLETSLRTLWEKARKTAEVIRSLRSENRSLEEKIAELDGKVRYLQNELHKKEQEFQRAAEEKRQKPVDGLGNLSPQEKAELIGTIKELLDKINTHL